MIKLGVNIDHIATLRNARGVKYPSLLNAAIISENNGADFITIHLREDRRHIKDDDLYMLKKSITTYLNLEMACNEDVLKHALIAKPFKVTLVPEKREEVTTEGGLNVKDNISQVTDYVKELKKNGIIVSLFIEPDLNHLEYFIKTTADEIEIHTGYYSNSNIIQQETILNEIQTFASKAKKTGLKICAGHGLNYHNTQKICTIKEIEELNICHSIISYAVFLGMDNAIKKMKELISIAEILRG